MSEQTTTKDTNTGTTTNQENKGRCCSNDNQRRCHGHRGRFFGKVIGLLLIFGLGFFAGKWYSCEHGWRHGGPEVFMSDKPIDKEHIGRFADKRLQHMLDEVKASDAQKKQASSIVKATLEQGTPLAEKLHDNHLQMRKLISAAALDKDAIEALRAEQIKLADEASKQMTQTMLAVANVLTPEQRAKLARRMEQHHGWHHD